MDSSFFVQKFYFFRKTSFFYVYEYVGNGVKKAKM